MAGTVILTGANGSAGLHASEHLLKAYPEYTAVFTVRSAADTDANTKALRSIISRYPNAKASIHEVDLANLTAVRAFTNTLAADISAGTYPPLKSIICNASYWNLVSGSELTVDGFDKTMQVSFIAHVALIFGLLDYFARDGGRIELLTTIMHYRYSSDSIAYYVPELPHDLQQLVHPPMDGNAHIRGVRRFSDTKLALTMWCYPLNRYLRETPRYNHITAVAMDPGKMLDSRTYQTNTPFPIRFMQKVIMKPFMPFLRRALNNTMRPAKEAGVDIVELAVSNRYNRAEGYFDRLVQGQPDQVVLREETQRRLWFKGLEWAGVRLQGPAIRRDDPRTAGV